MEPIQDSFGETPVHSAIASGIHEKGVSNFLQFSRRRAYIVDNDGYCRSNKYQNIYVFQKITGYICSSRDNIICSPQSSIVGTLLFDTFIAQWSIISRI